MHYHNFAENHNDVKVGILVDVDDEVDHDMVGGGRVDEVVEVLLYDDFHHRREHWMAAGAAP